MKPIPCPVKPDRTFAGSSPASPRNVGDGPPARIPQRVVGGRLRRGRAFWRLTLPLMVFAAMALPYAGHASIPEDPELWAARYNGPANSYDNARSIAVSPDGSKVFVTGESVGLGTSYNDYATVAYSAGSGSQLWAARYNGPGNWDDFARSIAVSPDGSKVFVTGWSYGSGTSADYATVAYSSGSGSQLWAARYNGPGNEFDEAYSIAVSPDGTTVFVTGESYGSGTSTDYATVAYSSGSGSQLWAARYNGPGNSWDVADSIAVSPDGSKVFVTGTSYGSGTSWDSATVSYSSVSGSELWAARYNGPGNLDDAAFSIAVSPDGSNVFVTGYNGLGRLYDYSTVAYSSGNGSQLWAARYNGPGNVFDVAQSIAVSPDGSTVFVTGWSYGLVTSLMDYATVAYSSGNGSQLWVARYNGPGILEDAAYSIAVSPDGSKVFVTGYSYSYGLGTSYDYATVAYSSGSGSQFWVARYNGPGSLFAHSIAVSPDGSKVFVTGGGYGSGTESDYTTVAYRASGCANGKGANGPVSGPVRERVQPLAGPTAGPYVHGVNCDVLAENGL